MCNYVAYNRFYKRCFLHLYVIKSSFIQLTVCRQNSLLAVYTSAISYFYTSMVWGLLMIQSQTIPHQLCAVLADYINAFVE